MIIKRDLDTHIKESLAYDASPEEYKGFLSKEFFSCAKTGQLVIGDIYHNPPEEEHTSKRKAYGGITWIEYWCRLIGFSGNHLKCSFCGADIFIDVDEKDALAMRMSNPKTRKEAYEAQGGHYHKNREDNSDGYIIIPVCKECNGRNEYYDLEVSESNLFVEEVGASIIEDE